MFEIFNIKSFSIFENPSLISIITTGKYNSIVYNSSDDVTQMVPIYYLDAY